MKLLAILLTFTTIIYGVIFTHDQQSIKFTLIPYSLFTLSCLFCIYSAYELLGQIFILVWCALCTFYLGSYIFGIILILKRQSIVSYILNYLPLLNNLQYKIIITYVTLITIMCFVDWIALSYLLSKIIEIFLLSREGKLMSFGFFSLILTFLNFFYSEWIPLSSIIYGLMYFLMHLKHIKILENLTKSNNFIYSNFYKASNILETDHHNFDSLVCYFPGIWLVHILFSINAFIIAVSKVPPVLLVNLFIKEFLCWPIIFFLINYCRSRIIRKILHLQLIVAIEDKTNGSEGHTIVQTLKRMANFHVTAGHFVNMDKGFILPFIGSVCTYTFLFMDKFKEINQSLKNSTSVSF